MTTSDTDDHLGGGSAFADGSAPGVDDNNESEYVAGQVWGRFTWALAAPWLGFLAFPIVGVVQEQDETAPTVVALAAIAMFAVVYLMWFLAKGRDEHSETQARRALGIVVLLVVLTVPVAIVIEVDALGMAPFLATFSLFSQPLRRGLVMATGWTLVTVVVLVATGNLDRWIYIVIAAGVSLFVGLIRWIDDQQGSQDALRSQLDVAAERERVARDVHDVLGHSLTVVTVKAELAERLLDADPHAAKSELAEIRSLTREALGEVRATVAGLRVVRLADELESARTALAGAGIDADVPTDPNPVDPRLRMVIAWVLREAVTNVVRHSSASRCDVRLGTSSLVVIDDGVGPGSATEARGLRGARERVAAAGGTLAVTHGENGRGTQVEVRW